MKYIVSAILLVISCGSAMPAMASVESPEPAVETGSAEQQLRELLKEYDGFSANFVQTVTDSENTQLHSAQGTLEFKQPGMFKWQIDEPEPELLLSNGNTLWWYNPFVEQVSIFDAADAVATTPFALLVSQQDSVWQRFTIEKTANGYNIRPKEQNAQVVLLNVEFETRLLQTIRVTSRSQRLSEYRLKEQSFDSSKTTSFDFEIPAGTDIDDQRHSAQHLTTDGKVQF